MEISKHQLGDVLEVRVKGRLDNQWADFFAEGLAAAIQEGAHHLRLNLCDVTYLSSAGIGVLVRCHQQLHAIQGTLIIGDASPRVRAILKLVALEHVLFGATVASAPSSASQATVYSETDEARFEVYEMQSNAQMQCRLIGDPERMADGKYAANDCQTCHCTEDTVALGLGAFGADFEECQGRFGEFISVAGCSAHLPTDGSDLPDFLISTQGFYPEAQVLYGLEMRGMPSLLVRFEGRGGASVTLSQLARACLQLAGKMTLMFAIAAEAGSMVGAALRASPDSGVANRFSFPAVRDWVTFTPATAARTTAIVVGVCSSESAMELAPFLRPLDEEGQLAGHFHAALFPHRPVQRGRVELAPTIRNVFQSHAITSVLHLLNDTRIASGTGESEFLRGACWIAPIAPMENAA
jgi:anti-anti-sigma factor